MFALLKLLPPETANTVALTALHYGLCPTAPAVPAQNVRYFGKSLPNPIGLAGGADKNGYALRGWQKLGFGFVEAGTTTVPPRAGNSGMRVWRVGEGELINWMGLPNLGYHVLADNLAAFRASGGMRYCVGVSLASPAGVVEDFRVMTLKLGIDADFFTLNASCPNVADHAASELDGLVAQLKAAKEGAMNKPVLVKLAPTGNMDALRKTVDVFVAAGADGFVACNTVPPAARNLLNRAPVWPERDGQPVGGYSGGQLFAISTQMVRTIRAHTGPTTPIIGVGGINSPQRAVGMLEAGASLIQVYTALTYQGPKLLTAMRRAIAA